jgi:spermidine synthase
MILLEELDTEFGNIKIIQSKDDGKLSYHQDVCFHSQINAEGVSTCAYVHVMYSLIRQAEAKKVLMIGCAGGTLATMLHRIGCRVTVVDVNPHAFTLAKKYFQMPSEIECIEDDGWSYLLRTGKCFDAIAVDAFNNYGIVPEQFTNEDFFMVVKEVLKPFGMIAINMLIEHDMDLLADRMALNMEKAGLPAMLFDWPGRTSRNTIVAGGNVQGMRVSPINKPKFVREEMRGVTSRTPNKRAVKGLK